jgi:asparagine synthase (glutamine-hydrolysing)
MREYWRFDASHRIHYRTDKEYEDHFRAGFAESVKRRLRSEGPVLAELSGGMDSSSIVCMADHILSQRPANSTRLDTISYYDDSEPDWNELPYLTKVEEARGRIGFHINAGASDSFYDIEDAQQRRIAPVTCGVSPTHEAFAAYQRGHEHRVLLSGIGGDEVLGGVPVPEPELADLLARAEIRKFSQRLVCWALVKRRPVLHLAAETARQFLPAWFNSVPDYRRPPSWLFPRFKRRYRSALEGYNTRLRLLGPLPSFQENVSTFEVLRRQLAARFPAADALCEVRYPYLDRDLVEFLYSIPREQILRPRQRRSLMRRALAGFVPEEVLNRRRKGFIVRGAIRLLNSTSQDLLQNMVSSDLGIVDANALAIAIAHAREGREVSLVALLRTIELERWLRSWTCAKPSKGMHINVRESRPVPEPTILHSDRATL